MNFENYYMLNESVIDTPQFKKWFKNSKIVDKEGNPLVVYHGTKSDFHTFDYSKVGQSSGRSEGQGFYFTTDKDIASGYSTDGRIIQAYISMQKPLKFDAKPFNRIQLSKLIKQITVEEKSEGTDAGDGFLSNYGDIQYDGLNSVINSAIDGLIDEESALDQLGGLVGAGVSVQTINNAVTKALGYDGIISNGYSNEGAKGGTIIIPFHPNQIKSINNNGNFDPNSPNMNESK